MDYSLPSGGTAFISVNDGDKRAIVPIAREVRRLGFTIAATKGTARVLRASGVPCEEVSKIHEGSDDIVERIVRGDVSLVINTPFGNRTRGDGYAIRTAAVGHGITHVTTLAGAQATVAGMEACRAGTLDIVALQDLFQWKG